jgi:hypothetical protein
MVPNFQITEIIENIRLTIHLGTVPQIDWNQHPALSVNRDGPTEIFQASKKFPVAPILRAQPLQLLLDFGPDLQGVDPDRLAIFAGDVEFIAKALGCVKRRVTGIFNRPF